MLHVFLLRSVNVGGHNRVPMEALRRLAAEVGLVGARTWIQSGNLVGACVGPDAVAAALGRRLAEDLGVRSPVIWRSAAEWAELRSPFDDAPAAEQHVAFLRDLPDPARVAGLDPGRSPGDRFRVRGREMWLHLPGGVAKSKLDNAWIDRSLATVATIRNHRTVEALGGMLG